MPHSIMRVDIAGRDVSRYLRLFICHTYMKLPPWRVYNFVTTILFFFRLLLRKEGSHLKTSSEFEVVRTIKEKACYLSSNPQKEDSADTEKYQYILPDGSSLEVKK